MNNHDDIDKAYMEIVTQFDEDDVDLSIIGKALTSIARAQGHELNEQKLRNMLMLVSGLLKRNDPVDTIGEDLWAQEEGTVTRFLEQLAQAVENN